MSVFVIKIIACISMFIDHTRFIFGKENIINTMKKNPDVEKEK